MNDELPAPSNFEPPTKQKREKKKSKLLPWLLAVLLAVASSAGVFLWQKQEIKNLKNKSNAQAAEIESLKIAASDHEADEDASGDDGESSSNGNKIENIQAAISSGNTAALEGYMASTVKVILAASEGIGDRTPTQAVEDLKYLDDATDPWDFDLPAETLAQWRAGGYGSYIPIPAVVGESANGYVVSFLFNHEGKISVIFMANDSELMEP